MEQILFRMDIAMITYNLRYNFVKSLLYGIQFSNLKCRDLEFQSQEVHVSPCFCFQRMLWAGTGPVKGDDPSRDGKGCLPIGFRINGNGLGHSADHCLPPDGTGEGDFTYCGDGNNKPKYAKQDEGLEWPF